MLAEPGGWQQPAEAVDHDRRPPPAAAGHQEHGLPEVLQHGAVAVHPLRAPWGAHRRPRRPGASQSQVSQLRALCRLASLLTTHKM